MGMDTCWGTMTLRRLLSDVLVDERWADPVRERDVFNKRGVDVEDGTRRCVGVWVVWVCALGGGGGGEGRA